MRHSSHLSTGEPAVMRGLQARSPCATAITLIAQEKRIPERLLIGRRRCRASASEARHLAMYLAHVVLGQSLLDIALIFGRDRTTVSYACAKIEDRRDDPVFDAEVERLERCLQSGVAEGRGNADH
ncbi:helix-turn-helix domain-containing protein [Devosia sp. RR2S18]|uniref:helix-turn-helix domain-containing protein n=1 Tax=Devosia rhizosphaerae TaxID=3049774 RepID=UPI002541A31A|nr:helix-turn-helix domain-containing protein [Devosia sp. RR2S18]WIJ24401.1 helix-turn-helix domain-containing protein [Devosia sp. RR2S18]